jgi:ABC-type amino acid transport substrate-binding protein
MKNLLIIFSLICLVFLSACISEKKRDPNVLVVATAGDMPPFNYYNENNELVGFDIDISNEIAKRLNKKIEFYPVPFSRFVPVLTSNRVDIVVSALDELEEMKHVISYSDHYMYEITFFVVKDNLETKIDSIEEVYGLDYRIGVTNGTTAARFLREIGLEENTSIYPSKTDLYLALNNDKVVGILADEDELIYINKKIKEINTRINKKDSQIADEEVQPFLKKVGYDPLYDHHMSIAVNKNNKELLNKINKIIEEMKKDGTISEIGKKWLGREPLPRYASE